MDRNVTDHKIDTVIDSFELNVEDNSDDDLQPVVAARKRKNRENTLQSGSQKRLKGKGKATDSDVTTTISAGISTTDETIMFNKITLDDYVLENSSNDFDTPIVKRPFLSESTKSAFRITKSTSVKSSFCPVPVDKASDIKDGPKKISKRVMTIKATFEKDWQTP
ncbi:hypothetical protein G6F37_008293 [Rhizopus arrhizus]|nr:hypothetical protein G6F38_008225 [Rhizopus arrhizus]KAG1155708.1 hypothetical protein G6F37_008293 [Rhizopus arrhizus]